MGNAWYCPMWYGICIHDGPPLLKNSLYLPNYLPLYLLLHWPLYLTLPISYHTTFNGFFHFWRSSFLSAAKTLSLCKDNDHLQRGSYVSAAQHAISSMPTIYSCGRVFRLLPTTNSNIFDPLQRDYCAPLPNIPFSAVYCNLLCEGFHVYPSNTHKTSL